MVRHELRGHAGDRAVGGLPRWSIGQPASRPAGRPGFSAYPLDWGILPESNTVSGDPSEVADGEVKAHLGNPGCYHRSPACRGTGIAGAGPRAGRQEGCRAADVGNLLRGALWNAIWWVSSSP